MGEIADALKTGVRNTAQAASDTADAAEDRAADARSQSESPMSCSQGFHCGPEAVLRPWGFDSTCVHKG